MSDKFNGPCFLLLTRQFAALDKVKVLGEIDFIGERHRVAVENIRSGFGVESETTGFAAYGAGFGRISSTRELHFDGLIKVQESASCKETCQSVIRIESVSSPDKVLLLQPPLYLVPF